MRQKGLITVLCTMVLLATVISIGQARESKEYKIEIEASSRFSVDGTITVAGESDLSVIWLCQQGPGGEVGVYPVEVANGRFEYKLHLRFGKGHYYILASDRRGYYDGKTYVRIYNVQDKDTRFTSPSAYVDSENNIIREITENIIDNKMTEKEKLQAIYEHINQNMKYDWVSYNKKANLVTHASVSLKKGKGMCRDYSFITAALTRSAGLPAKVVYGHVYKNGAWFAHAWNEVLINDKWVMIDTTWRVGPTPLEESYENRKIMQVTTH